MAAATKVWVFILRPTGSESVDVQFYFVDAFLKICDRPAVISK